MKTKLTGFVLGSLLLAGCYTTHIVSGIPPQSVAPMADKRWYHTMVVGIAELSPPVDLEEHCPGRSWSEIKEEASFVNGLVAAVTTSIYTPRTYTITCGPAMGSAPPPYPTSVNQP